MEHACPLPRAPAPFLPFRRPTERPLRSRCDGVRQKEQSLFLSLLGRTVEGHTEGTREEKGRHGAGGQWCSSRVGQWGASGRLAAVGLVDSTDAELAGGHTNH
jgi:hypothetical protein